MTGSGAKGYQRADTEDRSLPFREWHRSLDRRLLATDVDLIEWRYRDGRLVPAAVLEVTRVDNGVLVVQRYLDAIISRYESRDMQAKAARHVAAALGVSAYIVLFRENCAEFWTYNLTNGTTWAHVGPRQFEQFLQGL
jgi:hypothetical protein